MSNIIETKLMSGYIEFWNDQKNWKYTIEPHGDGYALYWGRTPFHHGYNLAHLTEIDQRTIDMIYTALNEVYKT